ncbi:MAG: LPXTG cell wall anchor domain-containing protein [Bacteroidetes bacterium]|uniref:LPXTG cell wall anchor domain-containing protein n=1 Tax=Candidatus Cryptobacteroides intestinigallinarum TaxID=2840767 RepID=A0A9D9N0F5_9BACT|nr:LPXTG cell wall anchor domain-containing protein [Candidatus Cryptobacteroides intestinigallinarum]
MIEIFYKSNGQMQMSQSEEVFKNLNVQDVVWIDLFAPTGDEKRAAEAFVGTTIQSRATAEEIESSSRFSETENAIFANTNFLIPGPEEYSMEAVSFIITGNVLTTLRECPLRSFTDLQRRMMAFPKMYPSGFRVFVSILEQRIDLDADMIELMSKEIEQYNRKVSLGEDINEEFLLDINQLQENTMLVRENIVDKQRVISSLLKSSKYPHELQSKLNVMLKDISSLINHTNFGFERLEYLQNTVIGLINLEQNKIMKVFTLVSLLLMPPTLIASFYGMNVDLPLTGFSWSWALILVFMLLSFGLILIIFKKRKML